MSRNPDFGRLAPDYDRIRPVDANWREVYELVVREADLRGRRVLDLGCGTGQLAAALSEEGIARVWGVDPEARMLDVARARVPPTVGLREGRAEELPFKDRWFDRVVCWLVVHLLDRPRAFAEARRVLGDGGRLAVVSFDASHFDRYWLNPYFPSIQAIDRARFPSRERLSEELSAAGFDRVELHRVSHTATLTRADALERIEAGHISTFDLLDPEEVAAGVERAHAGLPERIVYPLEWLVAVAS